MALNVMQKDGEKALCAEKQKSGLGRSLPRKVAHPVLKCDCAGPSHLSPCARSGSSHIYEQVAVGVEIWVPPFGLKRVIRAATILTEWTLAGTDHFMTARALTKLCWLAPGDKGGGAIWVANSCCAQALSAGYAPTLLTMEPLSASTLARIQYPVETMNVSPPYVDTPRLFVEWLLERRPNVVFLNNCDAMDDCIPYIPAEVRCVYVVHDTMSFYWKAAYGMRTVLTRSSRYPRDGPSLTRQVETPGEVARHSERHGVSSHRKCECVSAERDLTFLGGDDPRKGADDVLQIWPRLVKRVFGRLHWMARSATNLSNVSPNCQSPGTFPFTGTFLARKCSSD